MRKWNSEMVMKEKARRKEDEVKKAENTRDDYTHSGRRKGRTRKGGSFMPIKHYFSSI